MSPLDNVWDPNLPVVLRTSSLGCSGRRTSLPPGGSPSTSEAITQCRTVLADPPFVRLDEREDDRSEDDNGGKLTWVVSDPRSLG